MANGRKKVGPPLEVKGMEKRDESRATVGGVAHWLASQGRTEIARRAKRSAPQSEFRGQRSKSFAFLSQTEWDNTLFQVDRAK